MDDANAVLDIESIKQLKARYCRYLDAKEWHSWRSLFADDFIGDTTKAGGRIVVGADDFVAYTRNTLGKPSQATVHQVHAPEIALTSDTAAEGVWALNDVVRLVPWLTLHGYGHYHETYEKTDGRWRIKTSTLTRLREDTVIPMFSPRVAARLRATAARIARGSTS
jgi:hypothetical protein